MRAYATPIAGGARSPARLGADAATWLAGVVFALATIAVLYPGQYTFDAAYQIWQARTGQFSNQSPVFMTGLWALLLRVTGNPASLLCVNVALLWTGLVLCVVSICAGTLARTALLAACGLAPLTLVEMAHLLTDAHLAAVLVLAGGFAARWVATRRRAALCACLALALYAGCIRHNALLATLPFGAFIAVGLRGFAPRPTVTGLLGAIMLVAVSAAIGFGVDRAFTVRHVNMWPVIALWDLAAVSVDRHVLLLPPFTHGPGMTVDELSETGAFDARENTLLFSQSRSGIRDGVDEPYSAAHLRELFEAWIVTAVKYPLAYVHHRLRTFGLLIGRHGGDAQGLAYFVARVGYRDNPPFPGAIAAGAQSAFYRLASELRPTWLFAALPYLLAHALAFVLAWPRRRDPMSQLALTIAGSALLYALGYLPLAPAADLRYLTWPIVAAPLALAFAWRARARAGTSSSGVRISGA